MRNYILTIIGILFSVFISVIYVNYSKVKVGYVDATLLFSKYKMSEDLKGELEKIEKGRKNILDSIAEKLNKNEFASQKMTKEEIEYLKKDYMSKAERFSKELEQLKASYSDKIWKQLNQYSKDFGKEKKYQIILGANGQGSIMYAEDSFDLTDQLVEFANKQYEGKKSK